MSNTQVLPELKQIIGALLFAAREPIALETIRKVFKDAAKQFEGPVQDFAKVTDEDITAALAQLNEDLSKANAGIHVGEVANGYRLQNDLNCGLWIRQMLEKGRNNRLSKPALETLAIIAYRQPCTRGEIEAVRGVAVDAILKNLMEMQLVKAAGRSELPGRPWLFATTQKFLEYFGMKNVKDLPGIEELRRMEKAQAESKRNEAIEKAVKEEAEKEPELPLAAGTASPDSETLSEEADKEAEEEFNDEVEESIEADSMDDAEEPDDEEEEYDDDDDDDEDEDDEDEYDDEEDDSEDEELEEEDGEKQS